MQQHTGSAEAKLALFYTVALSTNPGFGSRPGSFRSKSDFTVYAARQDSIPRLLWEVLKDRNGRLHGRVLIG